MGNSLPVTDFLVRLAGTKLTHYQFPACIGPPRTTLYEEKDHMNKVLWIVQGLLAALFLFAGGMKLVLPPEALVAPGLAIPVLFLRFIGVCEVLGALGLILPGLLRIRPGLTPLAAAGLSIIMIGATATSLMTGPAALALIPFATGLLAAFVAYGRRFRHRVQR